MLTKTLITTGVMIAALLSASSGSAERGSLQKFYSGLDVSISENRQASPGEVREEFHQTYPFSPTGRVSVENINGEVRIGVWDRNDVQVDAVKIAYNKERLDEAKIEVNAGTEAIRIRTEYPDWDQRYTDDERGRAHNPATVNYTITVPRKARLESVDLVNGGLEINGVEGDVKASSVNGRVIARGLLGAAKLSTVNGPLEVTFAQLEGNRTVTLNSVNGPLTLVIPSDANASVRASTVHGAIMNDFGIQVHHGDYVGHELYGQIGQGGATLKLGNVNGPIKIKHAPDGRAISSATSLLPDKEKRKEKNKGYAEDEDEGARLSAEERREAAEARRAERDAQMSAERMSRETQAEVQREVERAIREAQREIERAQREVERETRRAVRNETRRETNEGRGQGEGEGRGYGKEFVEKETKTFTVSGSPSVNLSTFDGWIKIHAWDKSEVSYTALKRAGDAEEAKQIRVDAQQQGSSISIIARSSEDNGSASLEVYVPRNSSLHVSTGDGSVNIEGVSGDLDLRTGDGSIQVNGSRGQLRANTGDGSIRVSDFDGTVDARTGDGSISLDGKFTALAARTGAGSIELAVPANSDFILETDAEDVDNSGLTISEDIATSKRMRRWKVGRGGNVFTLSTGDGRVALRSR